MGSVLRIYFVRGSLIVEGDQLWLLLALSWFPAAAEPAFWHVAAEDRTDVADSVAAVVVVDLD